MPIDIHDAARLKELQALPLDRKIAITQARIIEWFNFWEGQVYLSFSGGKDSTVLLDLVKKTLAAIDPTFELPVVFSNTGLEYPEIQKFARSKNATFVTPKMNFVNVIRNYGYPLISKEVANAIYYARRIRNSNASKGGGREDSKKQIIEEKNFSTSVTIKSPPHQSNSRQQSERDKSCLTEGSTTVTTVQTHVVQENYRRKQLLGILGSYDDVKVKSKFNKKKWLPLVYTPFLISGKCCDVMKKSPIGIYQRASHNKPYLGTMAEESLMRRQSWIRTGCNAFEGKKPSSQPLSFWTEQDILEYIKRYDIEICSVYGDVVENEKGLLETTGVRRSGCVWCCLGVHLEKGETRIQALARTHPRQYDFCLKGGEWIDNPYYDPNAPKYDGEWENWNPKKLWTSNSHGLGLRYVFDSVNEIYGEDFLRYKV